MDKNGKSRHSVWLSDEVWQEVDAFYKLDNCPIATSLWRRRCGSIAVVCTPSGQVRICPRTTGDAGGHTGVFGDRLGKLLFKLVVEHNMTNHLLGGDIDMTRDEYNKCAVTVSGRWRVRMATSLLGCVAISSGGVTDGTADTESGTSKEAVRQDIWSILPSGTAWRSFKAPSR